MIIKIITLTFLCGCPTRVTHNNPSMWEHHLWDVLLKNLCVDELNNVDTWIEKEHNSQSSLSGMEEGRQQKSWQKRISKLMDIIPVGPGVVNRKYKVTVT